ncbi:MAG: urease subunit beta [Epulopiscium sp. Nuni2H_MBin001]|nr:MAG: urease subunit beta [Epulopiscium sp. Nuni2H_MBin001]
MIPGEVIIDDKEIVINSGKAVKELVVVNSGDRPIQVGSHYHFFEVNKLLKLDRREAYGFRLNIPSGTSVRFEPGEQLRVELVELGGKKTVVGLNGLYNADIETAVNIAKERGFMDNEEM